MRRKWLTLVAKWRLKLNFNFCCLGIFTNTSMEKIQNKKEHNKHQHNTDDGGQAMGEEMRHVQMSRWGKDTGERSEHQ